MLNLVFLYCYLSNCKVRGCRLGHRASFLDLDNGLFAASHQKDIACILHIALKVIECVFPYKNTFLLTTSYIDSWFGRWLDVKGHVPSIIEQIAGVKCVEQIARKTNNTSIKQKKIFRKININMNINFNNPIKIKFISVRYLINHLSHNLLYCIENLF